MRSTRIKICGITTPEDALAAAALGVDAIGMVFFSGSPRCVSPEQASQICKSLPPFVSVVGLFVNASRGEVEGVLSAVALDVLQFHGDEPAPYCTQFKRPWIKALRMQPGRDVADLGRSYQAANAWLLDTWQDGVAGGTGKTFDWARVTPNLPRPVVLAGGLNSDNVGQAIAQVRPAAVDVSGGVESAPGEKDHHKMKQFVDAVAAADV
ncbi:MAG: phosphoribosylanthranilate isomerase [Gammaproteobacteria bacterium]|jgi:phosphoribosylanthranilate isomerase|nr:phosphoribosylanthranilate isomerase [Gammaproteobacteria bacterium]